MITGFNTDIDHRDRVFHVQTEDKGVGNPQVETLIYCGGEIVASRRSSYSELAEENHTEDEVLRRMELQHQEMIREILNGHYDDSEELKPFGHSIITNRSLDEVVLEFLATQAAEDGPGPAAADPVPEAPPPAAATPTQVDAPTVVVGPAPAAEPVEAPRLRRDPAPAADPVAAPPAVPTPPASAEPAVVLRLEPLDEMVLLEGTRPNLRLKVTAEASNRPLTDVYVTVSLISTAGPTHELFSAPADAQGYFEASFEIPEMPGVNAAILCEAVAAGGRAEYRQLIFKTDPTAGA
ncbi:MAG: hypothetical protein GY716_03820 [bacterium]|nr:hypothetical protein [bacterium]